MAVRPTKTQISLGICQVWSESSLCAFSVAKDQSYLHADREDWSDWADAQADLSLLWVHSYFAGFITRWLIFLLSFNVEWCLVWHNLKHSKSRSVLVLTAHQKQSQANQNSWDSKLELDSSNHMKWSGVGPWGGGGGGGG